MKFAAILAQLVLLPTLAFGSTASVSYDEAYDNAAGSVDTVACSGILSAEGFTTFNTLPGFPNIGGASVVGGFDSSNCGTCWKLTYTNPEGVTNSINVLAIDSTLTGFNIALAAMNTLTGNQAVFLGRVNADATQVSASDCA